MKRKIIIITAIICILILLGATIFSIIKFNVWNPFSSCFGMLEILFTNKEYTTVQNYPNKVIFCEESGEKSRSTRQYLDEYMKNRGFALEEQLWSFFIYTNGSEKEYISYSVNRWFSTLEWE